MQTIFRLIYDRQLRVMLKLQFECEFVENLALAISRYRHFCELPPPLSHLIATLFFIVTIKFDCHC